MIRSLCVCGCHVMCVQACAGLRGTRKDHAHATTEMALEMIHIMSGCIDPTGRPIEVRIGIHTGNVISGKHNRRSGSHYTTLQ